jgi:hypothetical protein
MVKTKRESALNYIGTNRCHVTSFNLLKMKDKQMAKKSTIIFVPKIRMAKTEK